MQMKKRTRMVANTIALAENRVVSYIQAKLDAGYIGILKTKDGKKATGLSDYKAGANLLQRMAKDGMLVKIKFGEYMLGSVPPRPLPNLIANTPIVAVKERVELEQVIADDKDVIYFIERNKMGFHIGNAVYLLAMAQHKSKKDVMKDLGEAIEMIKKGMLMV